MEKKLILTEKPSVAADIAEALGGFTKTKDHYESDDAYITWAVGHLVTLAEPEDYDKSYKYWTLQSLPIIPQKFELKPIEKTETRLKHIKDILKKKGISDIVNACDAGREGELIFRYITDYLEADDMPVERLWLQSMTRKAIAEGFKHLRPKQELENLAQAARCRSQADWLIGINSTRAFTRRMGTLLSIGRVQTPTLSILVEREKIITSFIPQTYFEVFATFKAKSGKYEGKWFIEAPRNGKASLLDSKELESFAKSLGIVSKSAVKFASEVKKGDRLEKLADREAAQLIIDTAEGKEGIVTQEETKLTKESPGLLFDLNELQRQANKRFGFSASTTLNIAQALYEEKKLITYPRSDSKYLPDDYTTVVPTILKELHNSDYADVVKPLLAKTIEKKKRIFDTSKVSDHFAIIPTEKSPQGIEMTPAQAKVYDLIVKRFLAAFYPDAIWEETHRVTTVEGYTFRTDSKSLKEPGFYEVYGRETEDDAKLPKVTEGETVKVVDTNSVEKQTQPPPRYNDATLLSAMEGAGKLIDDEELREAMKQKGLGTPATRASIIERLIDVGYVDRVQKELIPTGKGIALYDTLMNFPLPELCSPEMTGEWEYKLTRIEQGNLQASSFMDSIVTFTKEMITKVKEGRADGNSNIENAEVIGKCPLCDGSIIENFKAFACENYKPKKTAKKKTEDETGCTFAIWKTIAGKFITKEIAKELLESGKTGPHKGFRSKTGRPFGATLLLEKDGSIKFEFDNTKADKDENASPPVDPVPVAPCPICNGTVMDIGSNYRCTNYKETCNLNVGKVILGKEITPDLLSQLLENRKTEKISGFISRKGRPFSAFLVMDDKGKVGFEFENNGEKGTRKTSGSTAKTTRRSKKSA
jgi:DNA topoisomerase-3